MNIFQELNKLPKAGINEVSYGDPWQPPEWVKRYQGKTYAEWAKELGTTQQCILYRIQRYGDPYPRVFRQKHESNFEGQSNTYWADILEVSVNTIQKRMKRFGEPFYYGDRNFIGNGSKHPPVPLYEGKTHYEWADILGITNGTVRNRLNAYGHPYGRRVCKQMGLKLINKRLDIG